MAAPRMTDAEVCELAEWHAETGARDVYWATVRELAQWHAQTGARDVYWAGPMATPIAQLVRAYDPSELLCILDRTAWGNPYLQRHGQRPRRQEKQNKNKFYWFDQDDALRD
jgi:hypothetical protein